MLHASPLASVVELREQLVNLPIYLQTNYDRVKPSFPEDSEGGSWHIRGAKVFVPVDDGSKLTGRIRLYAARGDLNSLASRSSS